MDKSKLEIVILEQRGELGQKRDVIERKIDEDFLKSKKIVVISGVRRSGKSTLLRQISKNLDGFYYFSFEDERLLNFDSSDFNVLLELFQMIYGEQKTFLFDEIQEIVGWEKFVSRLFRLGYKVFVTGSNAKLLSSELATHLTGRHLVLRMYPFSFREFLIWKKFSIKRVYLTKEKAVLMRYFRDFMHWGGFPEIIQSADTREFDQLYQDILIKDLLVRFRVKETKAFRELAFFYLSNIGVRISYNNLKNILKFNSVSTVKNYSEYLESSYLTFFLSKFDYSIKKQIINDKKVYSIDTGLVHNIAFSFSANSGRYLENIIFLELKRREQEIYYFAQKGECDFVVKSGTRIVKAIQVTESLTVQNKDREVKGLIEAMKEFDLKQGLILTNDQEDELVVDDHKIQIMPVWKWLLIKLK